MARCLTLHLGETLDHKCNIHDGSLIFWLRGSDMTLSSVHGGLVRLEEQALVWQKRFQRTRCLLAQLQLKPRGDFCRHSRRTVLTPFFRTKSRTCLATISAGQGSLLPSCRSGCSMMNTSSWQKERETGETVGKCSAFVTHSHMKTVSDGTNTIPRRGINTIST